MSKTFKINEKVTVFDQSGVITDVVDETRKPFLYGVTFDKTQKSYVIEAEHIETADVTKRIKTFADAINALGDDHPFVKHLFLYEAQIHGNEVNMSGIHAYLQLRIIVAALNGEDEEAEVMYAPRFRHTDDAFIFDRSCCAGNTVMPYHLSFKTRELAQYAGEQFLGIYERFMIS